MDLVTLLPTYLYLFAGSFLPETTNTPTFTDTNNKKVDARALASLCLAAQLWELKKSNQILIQGNGSISYLKKSGEIKPSNLLVKGILDLLDDSTVELSLLAVTLQPLDLIKSDLVASRVLTLQTFKKYLVLTHQKLLPDPKELELLKSHLAEALTEVNALKKDKQFAEILDQLS